MSQETKRMDVKETKNSDFDMNLHPVYGEGLRELNRRSSHDDTDGSGINFQNF